MTCGRNLALGEFAHHLAKLLLLFGNVEIQGLPSGTAKPDPLTHLAVAPGMGHLHGLYID